MSSLLAEGTTPSESTDKHNSVMATKRLSQGSMLTQNIGGDDPSASRSEGQLGGKSKSSKPSMKEMSKAERRAIQEKQRADKAVLKGSPAVSASTKQSTGKALNNPPPAARPPGSNSAAKKNPIDPMIDFPPSLQLFLHLESPVTTHTLNASHKSNPVLHHSILRLAQLFAQFKIVGSNARCMAMLEAFKHVIHSYSPPSGTSLSRHLLSHLSPQIAHLVQARPLSVSMGNAIRHLKGVISRIGMDTPDEQAKSYLCDRIDLFIRDRIVVADKVIQSHAVTKIKDGDVIMTYANSSIIQAVLLQAHQEGVKFSVVLVDSRPAYEAQNLLKLLSGVGINCTYILLTAIGPILRTVNLVLLGAHAMLANGAIYGRAGTAMIAMISKTYGIPVVCCCETYKFSERVMLDSIVSNEISTSQSNIPPTSYHHLFKFPCTLPTPPEENDETEIQELSLLYDVTRPEDITMVITEAGIIPVQSVPVLLRDYKPLLAE
ncbi:hypothetical protein MJO28_001891 [Puccinia striiformis f. sp. tritici]|nr:hypothetical protein Pst134EA_002877 [Puccinia striiformis f. sp. tritici]KAI9618200.1 hypothetical protein H4Q26_012552 [Puccinia striiformis f. sp. tritici PST-130]KNF02914.1 hypothetical protein PSTG_03862 [Puccinia striiformis f. sp. tritici PST-78]KAH9464431.1 hypothetical protein Pst134EB_003963 [Puccinia striiformis f. sp. tritici]KAH9472254.1 hypothetical protein Pst134EA_002877 [Puccinia striiformis f. sp. tritici]KAI7961402.1 hypothetical protein MJO28_001891 [Puccinia striiformis